MPEFSNREIAIGAWLAVFVLAILTKRAVRISLGRVLRSALHIKIAAPVVGMVLYVAVVVTILSGVGLWSTALMKETIYWFFGVGLVLFAKAAETKAPLQDWKGIAKQQLGVIVILTFIMNSYTFSVPVELFLVPIAVLIVMVGTVAEMKEQHADVARLFGGLQAWFGWFVLLAALAKAIQDYSSLASVLSFQKLSLPFVLTLLTLPYMYLVFLYARYDHLFVWTAFDKPAYLMRYMRRRAMAYARFDSNRINQLAAIPPYQFMRVKSPADFDALLAGLDDNSGDRGSGTA